MDYGQITLTPDTVTRVSANPPPQRRRQNGRTARVLDSTTITVDPEAWQLALAGSGGEMRRIEVLGPRSVNIHSCEDWRTECTCGLRFEEGR